MQKNRIIGTPALYIYSVCFTNRALSKVGFWLIRTILYGFFFLQFQTLWKWKKRRIVSVDHPLDETIPFQPGDVKQYMSFIPLWLKSLAFFRKSFGAAVNPDVEEYLHDLGKFYEKAGKVYERCQSTTRRPGVRIHPTFLKIHILDPHLHCVPSLHVAVVCFNAERLRRLVEAHASDPQLYAEEISYADRQVGAVIDSILTVKQHSINCIAAGLYFLNALYPGFSRDACETVVDNLLSTVSELPSREEIRTYVHRLLHWFFDHHDRTENADPVEIILQFLEEYSSGHFIVQETTHG